MPRAKHVYIDVTMRISAYYEDGAGLRSILYCIRDGSFNGCTGHTSYQVVGKPKVKVVKKEED